VQLNKVEISGGLTRDPDLEFSERGFAICRFTVAVEETYWDREAGEKKVKSHYIGCVSFGETAEAIANTYHKGDVLYVLGSLAQVEVEKNGRKDRKTRVQVGFVRGIRRGRGEGSASADTPPPF
jgi:single-strand DNA-binding protein